MQIDLLYRICRKRYRVRHLVWALFFLISPLPAAADRGLNLAGMEFAKENAYFYLGRIQSAGDSLGKGLVYRAWLDGGGYQYDKSNRTIEARYWRISGAMGYQHSSHDSWWVGYLGFAHQNTSLSPDDPESSSRGGKTNAFLQLEGETQLAPHWSVNGSASYTLGRNAYWLRGRVFKSFDNSRRVGGEVVVHGDPDYRVTQVGGLFEIPLARSNKTLFKAGIRTSTGESASAYGGIEFTQSF